MDKILLTGGTGFIGKHALEKIKRLGMYKIIVLSRKYHVDIDGVSYIQGDIADAEILDKIISRVDYVIHMAGCKKDADSYYSTNVSGTKNILEACTNNRVKKIIFLSSVGVIGPSESNEIDENTMCHPHNNYERSKYEAELLVKLFSINNPGKAIILRPTNVFGEDDPEMHLLNLINKIQKQRFYFVGNYISKYYLNYIYVKEISELIPNLLDHTTNSDLYILNTPTSLMQFITMIKQIIRNDTPVKRLPYWPIKLAAVFFDLMPKSMVNPPPINSRKLLELTNKKQYSSALIAKELNWNPAFSMYESLHNMIIHYYKIGLLK